MDSTVRSSADGSSLPSQAPAPSETAVTARPAISSGQQPPVFSMRAPPAINYPKDLIPNRPPTPPPPDHIAPLYLIPPAPPTTSERIETLQKLLVKDEEPWPRLRKSIEAVIRLYEEGRLKQGDTVYAQDGNIYWEPPLPKPGTMIYVEHVGIVFNQYTHRP
ncbi:hypothetical protein F4861DRAFT_542215 [Xylaria intraflava]|nr:hypothetical protein F4861DRAFT_542215 [Xylaria intraflava]